VAYAKGLRGPRLHHQPSHYVDKATHGSQGRSRSLNSSTPFNSFPVYVPQEYSCLVFLPHVIYLSAFFLPMREKKLGRVHLVQAISGKFRKPCSCLGFTISERPDCGRSIMASRILDMTERMTALLLASKGRCRPRQRHISNQTTLRCKLYNLHEGS
jgi:hypothetical protein